MADQVREARRRRILENSEKRLQRILGVTNSSEDKQENVVLNAPALPATERKQVATEDVFDYTNIEKIPSRNVSKRSKRDASLRGMSNESRPNKAKNAQITGKSLFESDDVTAILDGKIKEEETKHFSVAIVLIAITSITLLYTSFGMLIGHNVFIPFSLFEIYVLIASSKRGLKPSSNLINTTLMLSGLPVNKVSQLTKICWAIRTLVEDFCVYLFSCLICHQIYTHLA